MKRRKHSRVKDYLFGFFITLGLLAAGMLISVDIPLGDMLSLFDRGDGALSDALYALSVVYLPAMLIFVCLFTARAYDNNKKRRFYGMETVLAVSAASYALIFLFIPEGGAANPFFGILGMLCMLLSAPLSAVAGSAANGIFLLAELETFEYPWIPTIMTIFSVLLPAAALIVWESKKYEEKKAKEARKKK